MITTYILDNYDPSDKTVGITFINEIGNIHKRNINIPHFLDGSIDEEYLQEIIEGQLRGVKNKEKIGVVQFTDPNEETGIGTI